jgi:predicted transcriptional regulator
MSQKQKNIPVTMDDDLLLQIDALASEIKETRSAVMRSALRYGLPLVKSGSASDTVQLDGQLSSDVAQVAEWQSWPRQKVIIEAIRAGLEAVHTRWASDQPDAQRPERARDVTSFLLDSLSNPLSRDVIRLKSEVRALLQLIDEFELQPGGAKIIEDLKARRRIDAAHPRASDPSQVDGIKGSPEPAEQPGERTQNDGVKSGATQRRSKSKK